jgi:hypothetical protein
VQAKPWAERFAAHADQIGLPVSVLPASALVRLSPMAADLRRSDHAAFWDAGVAAIMITDTAEFRSEAYHCRGAVDDVSTLDLAFFGRVVEATVATVAEALEASDPMAGTP